MKCRYQFYFKISGALLLLLLTGLPKLWAAPGSCVELFDIKTPRTSPPSDFKFVVWRYNSGLLDEDSKPSFANAKIAELGYNEHSKTYSLYNSNQMQNNKLVESTENLGSRLQGGILTYRPDVIASELASGSEGDGLFERNQSFTFDTYEAYGYLSAEETRMQRAIARKKVSPLQITIVEGVEQRSEESLISEFGKIPRNARLEPDALAWDLHQSYFMGYEEPKSRPYELKVGSAWVVAGQANHKNMPLALEAEELANPINRDQYKFVFELGRAAQLYPFAHDEALRVSLFYVVNEVLAAGGRLEDAYIFAHAMDAKRATVFRRKYRMIEFSRYRDPARASESVTMTPLLEFLKIYKLEDFSSAVKEVRDQLGGDGTSSVDIYKEIFESRRMSKRDVSIRMGSSIVEHVEIRDLSNLRQLLLYARNAKLGESVGHLFPPQEYRDNIVRILESEQKHSQEARFTRLQGVELPHQPYENASLQSLDSFLHSQNAVEIYADQNNVPPDILAVAVYKDYLNYLRDSGIADPHEFLSRHDIRFAVTRSGERIQNTHAKRAGHWYILRPAVNLVSHMGMFGGHTHHVPQVYWESVSFTADEIAKLAQTTEISRVEENQSEEIKILQDPRLLAP